MRHAAEGKLKPVIGNTYTFEEVLEAYDLLATKRARGKVVIKVGEVV